MRFIFIVLGIITAALALVLAVTSLSHLAYFPVIAALIFGSIAFYLSKREQQSKKTVQLIFLLTGISLVLTTYKSIFTTSEVRKTDDTELKSESSDKDADDTLKDLDLNVAPEDQDIIRTEDLRDLEDLEEQ